MSMKSWGKTASRMPKIVDMRNQAITGSIIADVRSIRRKPSPRKLEPHEVLQRLLSRGRIDKSAKS